MTAASKQFVDYWGTSGSYTSAVIADYLIGSSISALVDHTGTSRTPLAAHLVSLAPFAFFSFFCLFSSFIFLYLHLYLFFSFFSLSIVPMC